VLVAALTACAASDPNPGLRDDFVRLRADLTRIEQSIQRGQADVKADLQQSERRTAQTLAELQRSVAQVGARMDDLGRDAAQLQGRIDDLRRRVDTLALQFEVAGPPPAVGGPGGRPPPAAPDASRSGSPATPPTASAAATRQATELYQTAYLDYTRGNYNLAVAAFKEFIRLYPETDLAEKAQYWIGEAHFSLARDLQSKGDRARATQEFERAVQEFRKVLIQYPRGDRVPSAVYKEALALIELGQSSLAEGRLQFLVDQFPFTEEAAKAKDELAKLRRR
jgi:TolA-binding protein